MKTIALLLCATLLCCGGEDAPVTAAQDSGTFTLSNGMLTAHISKRTGDLQALKFKDAEILAGGSGHPGGYWSHSAAAKRTEQGITIDPQTNGGERAEVAVKGFSQGEPLGAGPGGSVIADIEIRYALQRGAAGLYTYCIFSHPADFPATQIGEARFCTKLNPKIFDWLSIDAKRNKRMAAPEDWDRGTQLNMKEARRLNTGIYKGEVEHKYDYSAIQFEIPAFGWSGTEAKTGFWFVNPSCEYLSGGATKVELTGHLDLSTAAVPTLLNYWRGSHYGGSRCEIEKGEAWNKVVGPFLLYCNAAPTPDAMWTDALAQAKNESGSWPYDWVAGVDYPHKSGRGSVTGKLVLNDAQAPDTKLSNVRVGLAWPDVDWQQDAKHYEFWARGEADGYFTIPNVRPGTYWLHAISDGVLGEFTQTKVVVAAGQKLDLGALDWKPVRYGKQLWEIGIPNRSAEEFFHGDHYWQWGLYNDYPQDFPNDVNFVIGKSDFHKDWNYCQCPRADRPNGTAWTVTFELPEAPHGKASLRLAIAAASVRHGITVAVNDKPAGATGDLMDTATIRRDGIRGYWSERTVAFDAALLKAGTNTLKLTIPPGNAMSGIEYDYLRLELDSAH